MKRYDTMPDDPGVIESEHGVYVRYSDVFNDLAESERARSRAMFITNRDAAQIRADERAKVEREIVAWLRGKKEIGWSSAWIANMIERGEYLKEADHE